MTNSFNVSAGIAILSLMFFGAVSVHGLETVNLGTAEDFAILTKTGVTTTAGGFIKGDIGTSPIEAAALTGFGLILDSSNTFSTSVLVDGNLYGADYATPTPTKLITAISDMETAFVDAAGRSIPDHIELYTGDLTGAGVALSLKPALTPGLYKWGTGVGFTGGVTFKGSSTDIWILQIANDLTVGPGANIILEGGALPENIFWQVSGKTFIGAGAHVQGILLSKTAIIFDAGSSLTGRALSQTAVTMITTTITS